MKLRILSSFLFSTLVLLAPGCASELNDSTQTNDENEIVNVPQTDVERQSIGNCWLYAHASWVESMNQTATGQAFDVSQSYWTYWHWFDQIAGGWSEKIQTGGSWSTANNIVKKYGLMAEKDFVLADTQSEMSSKQKQALDTLNESLKSGALKTQAARRDKKKVRAEMDRAWGLSTDQSKMLNTVFGESVTKTFSAGSSNNGSANNNGSTIVRAQDFAVSYPTGPNKPLVKKTLSDAMRDWREVYYSHGDKRAFLQRVQRALHAAQPVIITWFVDFNALENRSNDRRGSFNMDTLNEFGPGNQGGHMTVLEDYQAQLADGQILEAGTTLDPNNAQDKQLLESALDPATEVQFLRVKNSWGAARPDRAFAPNMPGYHDLYMNYLDGDVKRCSQDAAGNTDTSNCNWSDTPLQNVVLPPGF